MTTSTAILGSMARDGLTARLGRELWPGFSTKFIKLVSMGINIQ